MKEDTNNSRVIHIISILIFCLAVTTAGQDYLEQDDLYYDLEQTIDDFFRNFSNKDFTAVSDILAGDMKDNFQNFLEMLEAEPHIAEKEIPDMWEVLGSRDGEEEGSYSAYARFHYNDTWDEQTFFLRFEENKFKIFAMRSMADEEAEGLERHLSSDMKSEVSSVAYRMGSILSEFDMDTLYTMVDEEMAEEIKDDLESEVDKEQAREMFAGTLTTVQSMALLEDRETVLVIALIEHKDSPNYIVEWFFKSIEGTWLLTDAEMRPEEEYENR